MPAIPTLSSPSNGVTDASPIALSLSWGIVSGASTYHLNVSTSSVFATTVVDQGGLSTNSAVVTLAGGTTYYWEVGAKYAGGTSGWSGEWSFTTMAASLPTPVLSSPTNGTGGQATSLSFSWAAVAGATSYGLQVSTGTSFSSTVYSASSLASTGQTVSGLQTLTTYFWQVSATGAGGVSSPWSTAWSFATASHFVVNYPNNGGLQNMSVAVDTAIHPTVNGTLIQNGDEIAVFNHTGLCVGSVVWNGANNAGITVWGQNPMDSVPGPGGIGKVLNIDGDSVGEFLKYRMWDAVNSIEMRATATYVSPSTPGTDARDSSVFEIGGVSVLANIAGTSVPSIPILSTPTNMAGNVVIPTLLSWNSISAATSYSLNVSTSSGFSTTVYGQPGLTVTSVTLPSLTNDVAYYWRVGAKDAGGVSGWSSVWTFTTIIAMPVLGSPTNGAPSVQLPVSLTWGAVAGASTYAVQVSSAADFGSTVFSQGGITGITITPPTVLANGAPYWWRAGAKDASGNVSGWSGAWSFTTIVGAPGAPTLSTPQNDSLNAPISLSLNWNSSAGATAYEVEVATSSSFGIGTTVFDQSGSATAAAVSGLLNDSTYYWRANASNIGGTSAWSGIFSFTTIVAIPDVPVLSLPGNGAVAQPVNLSLSWNSSARADAYALQVSTAPGFGSTVVSQALSARSFLMSGLANNVTYYWKVLAANVGGSSAWSGVKSFTTLINYALVVDSGWNMISFNVRPGDSGAAAVFGDSTTVALQHNFILVKSVSGKTYWPTLKINDLGVVNTGVGYQMFCNLLDTVRFGGSAVDWRHTPIDLIKGWNLLGYLPPADKVDSIALRGITSEIMLMKDNFGNVYWPEFLIDNIDTMVVGQGYFVYMKAADTLIYDSVITTGSAKQLASGYHKTLRLPKTHHYAKHANTGNNASILATQVAMGNRVAPDSCEIAAYDANGTLVGSSTVIHGLATLTVWGQNTQSKKKDGLAASEPITFKLWTKTGEYPVTFSANDGGLSACNAQAGKVSYAAQAIYTGSFAVPEGAMIKEFNLAKVYPNPFRGAVNVAFDVPTINGVDEHNIEINIFNIKGSLVHQIAKGKYHAGHYVVSWGGVSSTHGMVGSGIYVIQMKANNFDKRLKLVRVQ
jgi:hypothetical protein